MDLVYLDNAASTPLSPAVREAMRPWFEDGFGNPSSLHRVGLRARAALDEARGRVARAVGAQADEVVFTGGGSEANNLALFGLARARAAHGRHVVVGPTEHASVRVAAEALREQGFEVESARLDEGGALDLEQLGQLLREDTVLVAQMLVCNQFGSVYPLREVARLVRGRAPRAALHIDVVQALGKLDVRQHELDADSLTLSAHKLHGPRGVGALVLRRGCTLRPLVVGGGQEGGRRAGTENVAGIVGFGLAAEQAAGEQPRTLERLTQLRARLRAGLEQAGLRVFEPGTPRQGLQPAILTALVPGAPAEVWLHHLDARGVCVSTGSACQAKKRELDPALAAAGFDERGARQVLRLSLSSLTTPTEIDAALAAVAALSEELGDL